MGSRHLYAAYIEKRFLLEDFVLLSFVSDNTIYKFRELLIDTFDRLSINGVKFIGE